MKKKKKLINSQWRLSVMALAAFIGGSIGSQLIFLPDVPHLPSIYGWVTGSVLMVAANAIYVLYKKKKSNNPGNEKQNHG
ncbi:hypothetical protein JI666_20945 [Bacillus sp. NTK071]|uniref:Uncharacterized protein n=1 Tax=Guptibacillus hwajinpoensis TaxID=208199 RepID=A0A4U1M648_9BACL|nr:MULTISPECIES: hypothetical protein [Bacillaceae]MBN8211178.1 hypothetical protein [Bacillus sp. NTK071]TKD65702.1 hypothetical protein FBF83_20505 [Pseudalkalibacillus hwajinpoensis]